MRRAVLQALLAVLLRDRGALALGFVLPATVFAIFALIFAAAAGGDLTVRVAVADARDDAQSRALLSALAAQPAIALDLAAGRAADGAARLVRDGAADVGLAIAAGRGPLDLRALAGPRSDTPPLTVLTEPSREIASAAFLGTLQAAILDSTQDLDLDPAALVRRESVAPAGDAPVSVAYYAGAVAMLFLLISACNGGAELARERESGLLDRLATGPGGRGVLVDGWFLFLALQGLAQVTVIFAVAWLAFGVPLLPVLHLWLPVAIAAAVAAAGLGLAVVAACRSPGQAQVLGTSAALVVSALGGSMVPRFLMPPEIQDIGWLTPNTWALEGFAAVLWRGEGVEALVLPVGLLLAAGLGGAALARRLA